MAELGQQTVDFSALVARVAEESFLSIKELVEKSKSTELSDTDKKVSLLKNFVKTQQRMLRLNAVAKWCKQVPLINYSQDLGSTLSAHDICFTQAADSLFFMHEGLQQAQAPLYDVPSAFEILLTGSYQRLPKCIDDVGMQCSLDENQQKAALRKLEVLVRSKLLEMTLPKEITEIKVCNGTVTLSIDGEFKVLVTLGYRGHLSMWRILYLDLLVGERSGLIKLDVNKRHILGDDLERRMSVAENPFTILYVVLHELCVAIVMDTVIRQVRALLQGRWKDAIRFELISDSGTTPVNQEGDADSVSRRTPGVKLMYWSNTDKNSGPFIKIEPGSDLKIKCSHSTFVIDPLTGKEAEFSLNQSCIDVEKLLLKAICCNRYTRLFEIQKELLKNARICRTPSDVLLQSLLDEHGIEGGNMVDSKEGAEPEVLRVRAYGSSFFSLGMNMRTGGFLLQSSKSILALSILEEYEDALNQGSISAADAFINLRSKSILHLFATIGKFLGLEVYEYGFGTNKVPKNLSNGSSILTLGFPDCESSHLLLMELEKDFTPLFKLVETQMDGSGKPQSFNDLSNVLRVQKLDIEQIQILEDDLNLITSDVVRFVSSLPDAEGLNQASAHNHPELIGEALAGMSGSQLSFSSIVDDVFGLQKETSARSSIPNKLSSVNDQVSLLTSYQSDSLYNLQGPLQPSSFNLVASPSGKDLAISKKTISNSDQELSIIPSPSLSAGNGVSESGGRLLTESSLSSLPISQTADLATSSDTPLLRKDKKSRKRSASDLLSLIPSLQGVEGLGSPNKRRKTSELVQSESGKSWIPASQSTAVTTSTKTIGCSYGNLIAEANKGSAPSSVFVYALLHVIRHSTLSIKHAKLTSQMEALDIQYVEEMGLKDAFSDIWFLLPFAQNDSWQHICLQLGGPGNMCWNVKINDQHFRDLWELQKGSKSTPWGSEVHIVNSSDADSHIRYHPEGVVLSYQSVEVDSIKKLVAGIQRLSNARMFSLGMRKLLGIKPDEKNEDCNLAIKGSTGGKGSVDKWKVFKIEAVGLTGLWFSFGSGVLARFVVEWGSGKDGCTMHVSPDQLWPHTKFLEDFINGAEVESLLDCIRLTAGPLLALAAATRPARASTATGMPIVPATASSTQQTQGISTPSILAAPNVVGQSASGNTVVPCAPSPLGGSFHGVAMLAAAGRSAPGIVPSSLLPIDVSVVLHGPYWIRIIYRKRFAVDMRCFAGDQVWLQPATPPKGGASIGGSLPCPQFRPFIMEHVAQELNGLEPTGNQGATNPTFSTSNALSRAAMNRVASGSSVAGSGLPMRRTPGTVPAHVRGELNTAIIGLGDDGGYGGGWVPVVALKKVLRGVFKYLGVLWLFAQLPDLLREILGSNLKENLDQEQSTLRFIIGGYVFAVSIHRVQLLLQVLSIRRLQQQQQQNGSSATTQEELTQSEIGEICDYFSRRVASEPYDSSRVASFITLLTLPISVLREFLKLISWKKRLSQAGEIAPAQRPRIELCLENHSTTDSDNSSAKSNIYYDRSHNTVDFTLTVVLDSAHIPQINAAGGAAWLPYCVSVRLKYTFGDNPNVTFLGMEGSHGGRACWQRSDDWEKCKQRVNRTAEANDSTSGDLSQGKLKLVADRVQRTLNLCLQVLKEGNNNNTLQEVKML